MNLVKWLRKNNVKVMAVVFIVTMFGFIGGSYIRQFSRRKGGPHRIVAYFGNNRKITNYDLSLARRELEILKMLHADVMLRNISTPLSRTQDLQTFLLGELLFSQRSTSPILIKHMKKLIRRNNYSISDEQINDIYKRSTGRNTYWFLLKNEAQLAGVRISNEYAGKQLAITVSRLFKGMTYPQLIEPLMNRQRIAEKEILAIFGKLLAVMEYATLVCSSEDVTNSQAAHTASWEQEKIDAEFVKFDSSVFAETQDQPSEGEISEHFEKYKKFFPGDISEENPYGFGYKLPDRVELEYIAVKLDDISAAVTAPTQEEAEEYYEKHREQFTVSVPSDANDPNSSPIQQTKTYAEVANNISDMLLKKKTNSKANRILQEAKSLTEAGLEDADRQKLTAEQFKKLAGDYKTTADQLSKKYKIKVYAGRTGLLSAADIRADEYLKGLYVEGYGHNPPRFLNMVGLSKIVFSVEQLGSSELGPFDTSKPKMYENIGPLKDALGQIMAVMRITKAEKSSVPENVNQTYNKSTIEFERDPNQTSKNVYSVKEKVAEDLKKLEAMSTTKSKTLDFVKQVAEDGWDGAVDKFNKLYGKEKQQGEPNVFTLQKATGLQRISKQAIEAWAIQNAGNPARQLSINEVKKRAEFVNQLYSLVPPDSNSLSTVPFVMEFKPDMSYYCLKNLSVKRLNRDEYQKIKPFQLYREDLIQCQNLAAVHFNPENILKRMHFRQAKEEEPADANAPTESKGKS